MGVGFFFVTVARDGVWVFFFLKISRNFPLGDKGDFFFRPLKGVIFFFILMARVNFFIQGTSYHSTRKFYGASLRDKQKLWRTTRNSNLVINGTTTILFLILTDTVYMYMHIPISYWFPEKKKFKIHSTCTKCHHFITLSHSTIFYYCNDIYLRYYLGFF